jgi:threonine/homoserine/homoserine lactone efflux protein
MVGERFLLYVATESALSLSPGPAVLLVAASALTQGARRALFATLGILSANMLYFAVCASGLGSLLAGSVQLFEVVRLFGAFYLVYLGLMAICGKPSAFSLSTSPSLGQRAPLELYRVGLVLQLGNPKNLLFFLAILPQFIDPGAPIGPQMIWLLAGSVLPEFVILAGYGYLAGRARSLAAKPGFLRWTERLAGGLMLGAAALVAGIGR